MCFDPGPTLNPGNPSMVGNGLPVFQIPDDVSLLFSRRWSSADIYDPVNYTYAGGPSLDQTTLDAVGSSIMQRPDGKIVTYLPSTYLMYQNLGSDKTIWNYKVLPSH